MGKTYPILLGGEKRGTLQVSEEGLITVFSARAEDPGGLVRLSVYGGGQEGYLGVMQPENGVQRLCRRLSREAMRGFPAVIEYAAEAGQKTASAAREPTEAEKTNAPEKTNTAEKNAAPARRGRGTDTLWYAVGDGSLYTVRNDRAYRAIPLAAWGLPMEKAAERREIEGVEYAVFPLTDGRI